MQQLRDVNQKMDTSFLLGYGFSQAEKKAFLTK